MTTRAKQMTTAEAFINFFNDLMLERRTALPGKIIAVNVIDGKLQSVDVQLTIQQLVTASDNVNVDPLPAPIVPGVPYVIPRCQTTGFSLTVPIVVGDDVLLVFADRSIDNWQSTGKVSTPAEPVIPRTHDITDAIAIIGITNDKTSISDYDTDRIMMRNSDKSIFVSVSNSSIEINNNDLKISLENDQILLQNGASSIKIESNKITISSSVVEITGIDFENHIHSDPQGGNTGPPVNP